MHLLTFLLDHPDENLDSSIDLFNLPSTQLVSGYKGEDLFIHAFYSNGEAWNHQNLGKLNKITLKNWKRRIRSFFQAREHICVFICRKRF